MTNFCTFDWINPLATVLAVFIGAYLALYVENLKKSKVEKSNQIAAANIALHTIYNIWSVTEHLSRTLLDPVRESSNLWVDLPVSEPRVRGTYRFNLDSLAFLMDSSEPMVYLNLTVEEQRYEHVLNLIEKRSTLLTDAVIPLLRQNGLSLFKPTPVNEIEKCIGWDLKVQLECLANSIKEHLDENIKTARLAHDELRRHMKTRMPKQKFIKGEFTQFEHRDA